MSDPIDCTECWNGDDCELHPSAPVTDDSNTVGPAIKAYTIQEKRHEKELTKFKAERDALEKRCELQLETIRDLRLQLDLVTEDRQVEIETRQRLQAELSITQKQIQEALHAIEVKNRCVATINKLCSQVVELQAQLKGKE